jgi:hypothetical protein
MMAQSELVSQFAIVLGGSILLLLIGTGGAALAKSVAGARADRREREARETATGWFETRQRANDPAWEATVSELSAVERNALVDILEETLRNPSNSRPKATCKLANVLGVAPDFETVPRRRRERLRELDWAALLRYDADPAVVVRYVSGARDERESAARVLLSSSDPAASETATELILRDGPVSVFGLDTLYRHHRSDASALLEAVAEGSNSVSETALAHVLTVAGECGTPTERWVEWTTRQLDHDSDQVRIAAACAITAWETARGREHRQDLCRGRPRGEREPAPDREQSTDIDTPESGVKIWHTPTSTSE